jgi:AcrR family transcriptional regulator
MPTKPRKKPLSKPAIRGRIKQQKAALIQEKILEVAADLIAQRGFRAVTSDDISGELGFTKSIVYYYLKNKNDILWRIFERIDETYSNSIDTVVKNGGSPDELLTGIVRNHCLNVLTHQAWSKIYNRDEHELNEEQRKIVDMNKRRYTKRVEELYARGVEQGVFKEIPPVIAISCMIGACNWAYTWFKPTGRMTADEIATTYANQLIEGVIRSDARLAATSDRTGGKLTKGALA